MNNVIELKRDDWKGYKQTVTIDDKQVEYSYLDLQEEALRHTHLRGTEKGHMNFLPSVDRNAVLKDLVKLRGITADTLFQWLTTYMKNVLEYGADSWQDTKENCEYDFYAALTELDELKELFFDAVKAEQEA
ncbi:MAG: hypothetical protein AB9903_12985 [Vulcanimicrobiota bacterium]